jgi:hypothetical protein
MTKPAAPANTTAARSARATRQPRYHTSGRFAASPHVATVPARPAPPPPTLAALAPGIAKATQPKAAK